MREGNSIGRDDKFESNIETLRGQALEFFYSEKNEREIKFAIIDMKFGRTDDLWVDRLADHIRDMVLKYIMKANKKWLNDYLCSHMLRKTIYRNALASFRKYHTQEEISGGISLDQPVGRDVALTLGDTIGVPPRDVAGYQIEQVLRVIKKANTRGRFSLLLLDLLSGETLAEIGKKLGTSRQAVDSYYQYVVAHDISTHFSNFPKTAGALQENLGFQSEVIKDRNLQKTSSQCYEALMARLRSLRGKRLAERTEKDENQLKYIEFLIGERDTLDDRLSSKNYRLICRRLLEADLGLHSLKSRKILIRLHNANK